MEIRIVHIAEEVTVALHSSGNRSPKNAVGFQNTESVKVVIHFISSQVLIWQKS